MRFVSTRVLLPRPSVRAPVLLLILLAPLLVAPPGGAAPAPSAGDAVVVSAVAWEGTTVRLTGSLTVAPGAALTLRDVSLVFDGGSITVAPGGRLEIRGSTLTTAPGAVPGALAVQGDLLVEDSTLRGLGGVALAYPAAHGRLLRVSYLDNPVAVNVTRRATLDVEGSLFQGNAHNALWVADATARVRDSVFLANGGVAAVSFVSTTAGSRAFGEVEGLLEGSVVEGSGRGVHFQGADAALVRVEGNLLAGNGVALNLQSASAPTVRGNTLSGNAYAVANFGTGLAAEPWVVDLSGNFWGSPDGAPAPGEPNGPAGSSPVGVAPWLVEDPVPGLSERYPV